MFVGGILQQDAERSYSGDSEVARDDPDALARLVDKLVLSHLDLVEEATKKYAAYAIPLQDLLQDGRMGLVNAAVHFRPENGTKFTAYARAWIELELQRSVSSHFQLDNSTRSKAFEEILPTPGSLNEAEDSWDVPSHAYRVHEIDRDAPFRSDMNPEWQSELLDSRWKRSNQSAASWITMDTEPTASIERKEFDALLDEGLQKALEVLTSREQRIVEVLWLRTDDNRKRVVRDLAAEFGLGKGRIRQIEAEAFRKMRNCFLALFPQLRRA